MLKEWESDKGREALRIVGFPSWDVSREIPVKMALRRDETGWLLGLEVPNEFIFGVPPEMALLIIRGKVFSWLAYKKIWIREAGDKIQRFEVHRRNDSGVVEALHDDAGSLYWDPLWEGGTFAAQDLDWALITAVFGSRLGGS